MKKPDLGEADLRESTAVGQHLMEREKDLSSIRLRGNLSLEEAQVFHAMVERSLETYGRAYVLVDASEAGLISATTRRWIARWNQEHLVSGVAIYGGSLVARTLLTLLLNAIMLMGRQNFPAVFVRTEADARAWLTAQRR